MQEPLRDIALALHASETRAAGGFAARAEAAEDLEIHVLERLEILESRGGLADDWRPLRDRAAALRDRLESDNERVLARLRARIRAGRFTRAGLRRALLHHGGPAGPAGTYDGLDLLLQGLLRQGEPAEPRAALGPDLVPYQPTPARAILDLIRLSGIGPNDQLVDLGSGLGQVALLCALLSGARTLGIELEPSYVDYARRCAEGLAMAGVQFIQADARQAPLAGGTVFYLFSPFRGPVLRQVLGRLEAEARGRTFKLCTYGPCSEWVSKESWLEAAGAAHGMLVFRAR